MRKNKKEKIKVIICEPGKLARTEEIDVCQEKPDVFDDIIQYNGRKWEECPKMYFSPESVVLSKHRKSSVMLVFNPDAWDQNLTQNRTIETETLPFAKIIRGTFVIYGIDHEKRTYYSLTERQINFFMEKFKYPEKFIEAMFGYDGILYNPKTREPITNDFKMDKTIREVCYSLYKIDWSYSNIIPKETELESIKDYYMYLATHNTSLTYSDYLEKFGYKGDWPDSCASYEEFFKKDYRNESYICELLKDKIWIDAYLKDLKKLKCRPHSKDKIKMENRNEK